MMRNNLHGRFLSAVGSVAEHANKYALLGRALAWILTVCVGLALFVRYPLVELNPASSLPVDLIAWLRAWGEASRGVSPYLSPEAGTAAFGHSPGVLSLVQYFPANANQAWALVSAFSILSLVWVMGVAAHRIRSVRAFCLLVFGMGLSWGSLLQVLNEGRIELVLFAIAVAAAANLRFLPILAGFLCGTLPWLKPSWALLVLPLAVAPFCVGSAGTIQHASRSWMGQAMSGDHGIGPTKWRRVFSGVLIAWFFWGAGVPATVFGSDRAMGFSQDWLAVLKGQFAAVSQELGGPSLWFWMLRWLQSEGAEWIAVAAALGLALFLVTRLFLRSPLLFLKENGAVAWIAPWLLLAQLLSPLVTQWGSLFLLGIPLAAGMPMENRLVRGYPRAVLGALAIILWAKAYTSATWVAWLVLCL